MTNLFYIKTTCDLYINISLLSKRFQQLNTMLLNKCTSTHSNLITIVLTYCIISIVFEVVFNKREVVFYQSTKGLGLRPRPFVL